MLQVAFYKIFWNFSKIFEKCRKISKNAIFSGFCKNRNFRGVISGFPGCSDVSAKKFLVEKPPILANLDKFSRNFPKFAPPGKFGDFRPPRDPLFREFQLRIGGVPPGKIFPKFPEIGKISKKKPTFFDVSALEVTSFPNYLAWKSQLRKWNHFFIFF